MTRTRSAKSAIAALLSSSLVLGACSAGPAPANVSSARWAPGQSVQSGDHPKGEWVDRALAPASQQCALDAAPNLTGYQQVSPRELGAATLRLGPGDRLLIEVLGDPDGLSGSYVVDSDGTVSLGTLPAVKAQGRTAAEFSNELRASLIGAGLVRPLRNAVRVRLAEAGGVAVTVSGAVFQAGSVRPGERTAQTRIGQKEGEVSGDANAGRTLSTALRAAGGVRPDADVTAITLVRGSQFTVFDMSGMMGTLPANDPVLAAGDRIIVPETSCFDESLVRPGPLTQPGIKVYMSNLTRSANNNAGAAIGAKTGELPYGTRMLQALVAMNCVGGTYMQSDRRAVLISRNPRNGQSIVIERDIEKLVRKADRDLADPYLMPGDALACYDSKWTNFREALSLFSDVAGAATPAIVLQQAAN
ncbi:polysaccharide biosynthesis/export family protein [Qipengyuania sp. DSG2-2]|uniref:polysaccharide biosynthesis/export family protein n=1 Tax=Qipengyuania sp. DGS2-2 TaxID=3349631 RepID=UPI0036D23A3D